MISDKGKTLVQRVINTQYDRGVSDGETERFSNAYYAKKAQVCNEAVTHLKEYIEELEQDRAALETELQLRRRQLSETKKMLEDCECYGPLEPRN
jgi:chromosome segregation ATPase